MAKAIPLLLLFLTACATPVPVPAPSAQGAPVAPEAAAPRIQAREHWVTRGTLRLNLWEKKTTGRTPVILVHGATWSGRPDFDLQIRDYSLMDALARAGFDVFSLDIHGYGRSVQNAAPSLHDRSDTHTAVLDLGSAVDYVRSLTGAPQVALLGWSWGTQIVGIYAQRHPDQISRLVLYAPLWKGKPSPAPKEPERVNTDEDARDDFTDSAEPDVVSLYAREALAADPRSPNGAIADLRTKLPILTPEKIQVPTLVIQAENDPISKPDEILPFYAKLGASEREHVLLPGSGHAVHLEKPHLRFQRAVIGFLKRGQD